MSDLRMPQAGMEMTEGLVGKWLVPDGGYVEKDSPLYEIQTDKVEMVIDAPVSGVVTHVAQEGDTLAVGELVGHIEDGPEKGGE